MHYKKTISEAKRTVEAIKLLAPDINTGDHKLEDLEQEIARGEALDEQSQNLRGQVSAMVATKFNVEGSIREMQNGMVHAIRSSKHPKKEEVLRFLRFKLPWEFASPSTKIDELPPSGQAPMAA